MIKTAAGVIGLIADTHGQFRAPVQEAFRDVELILHAGDIGGKAILEMLGQIAPVVAVRGNTDRGNFAQALPALEMIGVDSTLICLVHDLHAFRMSTANCGIVVFGHTHRAVSYEKDGTLFINPGSAGPKRFTLPISVARLDVRVSPPSVDIIFLEG